MKNTIIYIISLLFVLFNLDNSFAQVDSAQYKADSAKGVYYKSGQTISLKENNEYDAILTLCMGPSIVSWGRWYQKDSIIEIDVKFSSLGAYFPYSYSLVYRVIDQDRFLCKVLNDSTTIKKILVNVENKNGWGCYKAE